MLVDPNYPMNISWDLNTVRDVLGSPSRSADGGIAPLTASEVAALHDAVPDGAFTVGRVAVLMDQPTAAALSAFRDTNVPQMRAAFLRADVVAASSSLPSWAPWAIGAGVLVVLGGVVYAASRSR